MEGQNFFVYSDDNKGLFIPVLYSYTYINKQARTVYTVFYNSFRFWKLY